MIVMISTFMFSGKHGVPKRTDQPPSGRVERVYLVQDICARHLCLHQFEDQVGLIEGYLGEDVLVRFGDEVMQVPADMLVEADKT